MNSPKKQYPALDIMKWLCAWLVVVIHTAPLKIYSQLANLYTAQGICRLAVPMFFCSAGFLLLRKLGEDAAANRRMLLRYCLRIFGMYALWAVVYFVVRIPIWIESSRWGTALVLKQLRLFFFDTPMYHLWYLLVTVYAVPLVYLLHKAGRRVILAVTLPIWCIWAVQCWTGFFPFPWLLENCGAAINTLLCAVPLMCLGSLAISDHKKYSSRVWLRRSVLALVLFLAELTAVFVLSPYRYDFRFLVSTPVVSYCLLCWLLSLELAVPDRICAALRHGSTWIYCFHPLVMLVFERFVQIYGLKRFAAVAAVTLLTSAIYAAIKITKPARKVCGKI